MKFCLRVAPVGDGDGEGEGDGGGEGDGYGEGEGDGEGDGDGEGAGTGDGAAVEQRSDGMVVGFQASVDASQIALLSPDPESQL